MVLRDEKVLRMWNEDGFGGEKRMLMDGDEREASGSEFLSGIS